jgi:dTDP-D-glucose 4,6-dehydratase
LTYAGNLENIDERIRNSGKYSFEKVDIRNLEEVKKVF